MGRSSFIIRKLDGSHRKVLDRLRRDFSEGTDSGALSRLLSWYEITREKLERSEKENNELAALLSDLQNAHDASEQAAVAMEAARNSVSIKLFERAKGRPRGM